MEERVKKLYRSKGDRVIAGVCGGLGDYFEIDPILIRLFFIIFLFAGGSALLAYLVLWIVIPEEGGDLNKNLDEIKNRSQEAVEGVISGFSEEKNRTRLFAGIVLFFIGLFFLLQNLGLLNFLNWSKMWPLVLILFALLILFKRD